MSDIVLDPKHTAFSPVGVWELVPLSWSMPRVTLCVTNDPIIVNAVGSHAVIFTSDGKHRLTAQEAVEEWGGLDEAVRRLVGARENTPVRILRNFFLTSKISCRIAGEVRKRRISVLISEVSGGEAHRAAVDMDVVDGHVVVDAGDVGRWEYDLDEEPFPVYLADLAVGYMSKGYRARLPDDPLEAFYTALSRLKYKASAYSAYSSVAEAVTSLLRMRIPIEMTVIAPRPRSRMRRTLFLAYSDDHKVIVACRETETVGIIHLYEVDFVVREGALKRPAEEDYEFEKIAKTLLGQYADAMPDWVAALLARYILL